MGIISKHCRKLVMEILFQLLLKGCTIEAPRTSSSNWNDAEFQLLLKGCTIEAVRVCLQTQRLNVSVVVERMYD